MAFKKKVRDYGLDLISKAKFGLTEDQVAFFNRLYPKGIESFALEEQSIAYAQVARTVDGNRLQGKE